MSFNNIFSEDLERGSAVSGSYKDFPEFETISKSIDDALHKVNQKPLITLKRLLKEYGTLRDVEGQGDGRTAKIRHDYAGATSECTESFKTINDLTHRLNFYLSECEANHEDQDELKYLRQKEAVCLNLIKNSVRQFQNYQRRFKALESRTSKEPSQATHSAESSSTNPISQNVDQLQVQIEYEPINAEELEQQSLMVEEREREIRQISQDTQEINEIFSNLQDIMQEQQFQVDSIEDNILSYNADAQGASRELRKAERYQRRSGGRMLCCLLILIGVFGSVILIGVIF